MLVTGTGDAGPLSANFSGSLYNMRQWEEYRFFTEKPIDEDDVRHHPDGPPYPHVMVAVRRGAKMILLTERKKITEFIIRRFVNRRIYPNPRKVRIHVGKLIASCEDSNSEYAITTLHGSFAGGDSHVQKISLYGDDITDSSLYREQHHLFNFYSCGVARRLRENLLKVNIGDESGISLIGNDGFIYAQISGPDDAREVILLINYIIRNRWVDSWVPDVAMG